MIAGPIIEKLRNYSVEGFYMQKGETGIQRGWLTQYSDGKLIGIVKDKDKHHAMQKMYLGMWKPNHPIRIIKLPFLDRTQNPLIWQFPACSEDLAGKHEGSYLHTCEMREMEIVLSLFGRSNPDIEKVLEGLTEMPIADFDEVFFEDFANPKTSDNFKKAIALGQIGGIELISK